MRPAHLRHLIPGLVSLLLAACGSGGGGDSHSTPPADPYDIDSYAEYDDGDDLSGIWMMVINAEYDYATSTGEIKRGSTQARTTLFMQEYTGGISGVGMSALFCAPPAPFGITPVVEISGTNLVIDTLNATINLSIDSNSSMRGDIDATGTRSYACGLGGICIFQSSITSISSDVQLKKIAPLPAPADTYNFVEPFSPRPSIGNINGYANTSSNYSGASDAINVNFDPVTCLSQVHSAGQHLFPRFNGDSTSQIDYEEVVVNYGGSSELFVRKTDNRTEVQSATFDSMVISGIPSQIHFGEFANSTITTSGANPSTIIIELDASGDASSDATSDAFEINLDI